MNRWLIHTSDNRISLHDHCITSITFTKDIILHFEDGFDVLTVNNSNTTGRHKLTGCAAVILRNGRYLYGSFEGPTVDKDGNKFEIPAVQITQQEIEKFEIEVLSYQIEIKDSTLSLMGFLDVKARTLNSPFCSLTFSCNEILYCWNEFVDDAWFQDWNTEK